MGEEMKGRIALDTSLFSAGIGKAKALAKDFGVSAEKNLGISAFKGMVAGALSVGAVTNGLNSLLEKADGIDALAKRFDLTAEAVQSIQFAADQSGASAESMFVALKKINIAQQEALGGSKDMIEAFAGLGVTIEDLQSKNFEQIFYQIGQRVNGASLESVRMGDAIKVMGKSGDQVLGAMRDGFADIAKGARDAGVVIKNELVRELANAKDQIGVLSAKLTVVGAEVLVKALAVGAKVFDDSLVGWYSRAAGALSAGASFAESMRTASNAPWVKELNDLLKATPKKVSDKGAVGGSVTAIERPELGKVSIPTMNLTSNQQIGAYSAQNPMLNRQIAVAEAMLELQRRGQKMAQDTAQNTAETVKVLQRNSDYE